MNNRKLSLAKLLVAGLLLGLVTRVEGVSISNGLKLSNKHTFLGNPEDGEVQAPEGFMPSLAGLKQLV